MFNIRNFLILAFLFAAAIAITWYSFRRTNYDANQYEDGVDIAAPFYETHATAPHGEHTTPEIAEPAENEIRGGKENEKGGLIDSSVNQGVRNIQNEGHGSHDGHGH